MAVSSVPFTVSRLGGILCLVSFAFFFFFLSFFLFLSYLLTYCFAKYALLTVLLLPTSFVPISPPGFSVLFPSSAPITDPNGRIRWQMFLKRRRYTISGNDSGQSVVLGSGTGTYWSWLVGGRGVTCEELLFGADYFYLNFLFFCFFGLFFELHTRTVMENRRKEKEKLCGANRGFVFSFRDFPVQFLSRLASTNGVMGRITECLFCTSEPRGSSRPVDE